MDKQPPKGLALLISQASSKAKGEDESIEEGGDVSEMGASVARDVLSAIKSDDENALSRTLTNLIRMCKE